MPLQKMHGMGWLKTSAPGWVLAYGSLAMLIFTSLYIHSELVFYCLLWTALALAVVGGMWVMAFHSDNHRQERKG